MPGPAEPPIRARDRGLSRIRPIDPARTALLVVDIQNATFNDAHEKIRPEFFTAARDIVIPNLRRLVDACRRESVEVIYTVMENLTRDGRDRSLDYKLSDFFIARGSWEAKVIDALAPVTLEILGGRMPIQANEPWLSIVPIAESRSSYNGLLVMVFITISASLAVTFIHRFASHALRRGPAWGCGFSDPTPAAQYSGGSFAQPIRRVFGTLVFRARDHVEMPPPGDIRPARLRIELHDLAWEGIYEPIAAAIGVSSERLNRLQFLTIRRYLSLVFATLVTLLLVLAIWS